MEEDYGVCICYLIMKFTKNDRRNWVMYHDICEFMYREGFILMINPIYMYPVTIDAEDFEDFTGILINSCDCFTIVDLTERATNISCSAEMLKEIEIAKSLNIPYVEIKNVEGELEILIEGGETNDDE